MKNIYSKARKPAGAIVTWDLVEMDFLEILPSEGKKAFSMAKTNADMVIKVLLNYIIPILNGLYHPDHLDSNRGSHFVSMVTQGSLKPHKYL